MAEEQELQQFWATAKLRMQQLGYSDAQRGEIKGLLLTKTLPVCKQYFDGNDVEVKSALNQLLTPGRSAHEAPPGVLPEVPFWLSELFHSLAGQTLTQCSITRGDQQLEYHVLPLGAPLKMTAQEQHSLYMLPVYREALSLFLGSETPSDILPLNLAAPHANQQDVVSPTLPAASGALPEGPGTLPEASGALPAASGALPAASGTLPEASDALPAASGALPEASGAGEQHGQQPSLSRKHPLDPPSIQAGRASDKRLCVETSAGRCIDPASVRNKCFLIMGVAGVGKSMFLFVLAWVLLRLDKTVLLHLGDYQDAIFVIRRGQPVGAMHRWHVSTLLENKDNWYLCDSATPITSGVWASTVTTATPKAEATINTMSKIAEEVWFGPWTLIDLLCGNAVSKAPLQSADVEARFDVFGGSAREVFRAPTTEKFKTQVEALDHMIATASTDEIIHALSAKRFRDDMSNKIFHVTVSNHIVPLSPGPITFASPHVGRRLLGALQRKGFIEVQRFLTACINGPFKAAAAYLTEACIDKALTDGGLFDLVHLPSGIELKLQLPKLLIHTFTELRQVVDGGPGVWVPTKRGSWPVADTYVVLPNPVLGDEHLASLQNSNVADVVRGVKTFMVQTTVAASHDIPAHKYKEQSIKLHTTMLVFAVPPESSLQKAQRLVTSDGKKEVQNPPAINQFALVVPSLRIVSEASLAALGAE